MNAQMIKCANPNCHNMLGPTDRFCGECGTNRVSEEIRQMNAGATTGNSLQFNPATGRFEVVRAGATTNPDAVVVDQMAKKGFAAEGG